VKLSLLLDKWLEPTCTFWTATDPVAPSATSGAMRKKRGVKPRRARYVGFVSWETDRHRAEIQARTVQSVAANGPRGTAAGGRRMVGMSFG